MTGVQTCALPIWIVVLDYQAVNSVSTPYADVALFITYLDMFAKHPLYRSRDLAVLKQAFFRGYDQRWLSLDVLQVYQIRAMLTLYTYASLTRDRTNIIDSLKRCVFTRWVRSWLIQSLRSLRENVFSKN